MFTENSQEACNWLAKSSETESYDLVESAKDNWDIWTGIIQTGSSLSMTCNECERDSDCNYNGKCKPKEKE